ncbi:MAG: hypothetical protein EG826_01135 [Deltaproteobacteria bacterium]|nr:hypothetical protein [Deltaproteobacteria bacterium]
MLKVIEDEKLIRKYAKLFAGSFKPFTDESIKVKLGHQGASFRAKVSWSKKLGLWIFSQASKKVRYWNAFGTGRPPEGGHLPITAEINFPWAGIDRKTGAAFACDAWNRIYVIHRGKIGGGKKGVGKSLFEEYYRGVWAWMEDGDALSQVAVVGALGSSRFALQTAQFVAKIERLKSTAALSSQTSLNFSEVSFREELVGNPPPLPPDNVACACDRNLVISHLAELLERWKFKTGNDANHDLFLVHPATGRISHVLAVCACSEESDVLQAAAKLLLQQATEAGHPAAVLIMPEEAAPLHFRQLERIHIDVVAYRLEGERIIFPDLGKIRQSRNFEV